ncbi:MAG: efflux RND transporter periplasmic adaptor subunit [Azonexaceae bacterium]|nr:efflux RND transporter periplasmic adaptor subunit [Azonexaceae bacterium]
MKAKSRRPVLVIAVVGLLGLAAYAWSLNRASAPVPVAAKPAGDSQPTAVETARVTGVDFADEATAVGTLKSNESVVLKPEASGRIAGIGFRDGALVDRGALLITLDAAIPDAELAQAKANLALARTTHERNQELLGKKFISPQALDASAAALKVQEAAVQLAEAKAARMRIRAPFRGIVGLREVSVGDYVKEGETLVNIEDISSLRVDFRLAEAWLDRLARGQAIELSSDALPGKRFAARLEAVDPQIDPEGRSISVRARLDNRDGSLRPGMFVRVRLSFGERKGVPMVPEAAVMPGARPAVYKVVDGKAERVAVRLGARRDAQVEISEGLAIGDQVVTAGQLRLKPGAPVNVAAAAESKPAEGKAAE